MDFSDEFPIDDTLVYLNHAAVAPWPRRTALAVQAFAQQNLHRGAADYPAWVQTERRVRQMLCALINAPSPDDIALLKNTSEALSVVAHGLDWQNGDNVVITDQEFPSNRIVWESLARYGVEVRYAGLDMFGTDPETAILGLIDERTRLISVSSVQYATGLRLDLERLGETCRSRGVLFCIDAIQSLGAIPLDVAVVQADFVMADAHKWLLGPEGIALFYCRAGLREKLRLHQYGWRMVEHSDDFDRHEWTPATSARRFECGSPNMLGIHALEASLSLLLEVGIESVSINVINNARYLIDSISSLAGFTLRTPSLPGRHAGIVNFLPDQGAAATLFNRLRAAGVVCALRGGGIRFSPHFYTTPKQLDRALALLAPAA